MTGHETRTILVTNIYLDLRNPRHDISDNQVEAILATINDQGKKLINLANDIVKVGLNPSDLPIVIQKENDPNSYVVLEGNRRVLALKLLLNPTIIKGHDNNNYKRFKELSDNFDDNYIDEIKCVVFSDRESANRWIKLKHTGENNGVGIVGWGGIEVARFTGSPSLQVVEFVRKEGNLSTDEKEDLDDIAITNLERLIRDPRVRKVLGISLQEGRIESNLKKEELLKGLEKITKDLIHKNINVNNIRLKEDRADYIESFEKFDLPDHKQKVDNSWEIVSSKGGSNEEPEENTGVEKKSPKKSTHLSTKRKHLIPSNFIVQINDSRVNTIYRELKRINIDDNINAVSVLLRVFLELSIDRYKDIKKLNVHHDQKLINKIELISKYFEKNSILSKAKLKPVRTSISNPNALFSTHTFNAYVHNIDYEPIPKDLKLTWNNMSSFMEKLLEEL